MTDPTEGRAPVAPNRKTLLIGTTIAAGAALLIIFGAVLPAEYDRDPLGIGKATGLLRLWAPAEVDVAASEGAQTLARAYPTPFRTDEIVVTVKGSEGISFDNLIEYKVRMPKGATLVYSWTAEGLDSPSQLFFDFHGHTLAATGTKGTTSVSKYAKGTGDHGNGALVAPIDGIHGWLFQNAAAQSIRVRVRLAGFYTLIPPGQEGNMGGFTPAAAGAK